MKESVTAGFLSSQGIKAVIAESYERIHRSNLVGMGVIPLEFLPGDTADSLGLTGRERYTITIPDKLSPRMVLEVKVSQGHMPPTFQPLFVSSIHDCWPSVFCSWTLGRFSRWGWGTTRTWSWPTSTTEASSTTWSAKCLRSDLTSCWWCQIHFPLPYKLICCHFSVWKVHVVLLTDVCFRSIIFTWVVVLWPQSVLCAWDAL